MDYQSCLNNLKTSVVSDTSVAINLNATGFGMSILDALPNRFVIVEEVMLELKAQGRRRRNDTNDLITLVATSRVEIVRLGNAAAKHFIELVSGPAAETLDDGEAATIAYALEHGAIALIDERKANRICAERFAALSTGCTIDLLAHDVIEAALGRERLADAVFNALYHGRMHVLEHQMDWVVGLIGSERAAKCVSLPASARTG